MLNPSIGKLLNHYESRYQLCVDVAKNARRISMTAERDKTLLSDKPVTLALNYLAEQLDENS